MAALRARSVAALRFARLCRAPPLSSLQTSTEYPTICRQPPWGIGDELGESRGQDWEPCGMIPGGTTFVHAVPQRVTGLVRRYSAAATTRVKQVSSDTEFQKALDEAKEANRLVVIDFTAKWCAPCKQIAPIFEKLSTMHEDVDFVKADIDQPELFRTVELSGISAVPTFHFHKGGQKVAEFSGADIQKLQDMLTVLKAV